MHCKIFPLFRYYFGNPILELYNSNTVHTDHILDAPFQCIKRFVKVVTVVTVTEVTVFQEGVNWVSGSLRIISSIYIINYNNIYTTYNLFLKTEEDKGDSKNCNFCNRNHCNREITLPRTTGELMGKHRETLRYS